ncbi:MAG: branched-chain amino acid ABC transporter permease [Christensenellaceae bacterium]|nr:branched-chain amino acid ABC transporter permease [Christensenellaceae bacterium]
MRKCEVSGMKKSTKILLNNAVTYGIVIIAFLLCELAISGTVSGFKISRSLKGQLVPICVYVVMAVSLNLVVGFSGELSLGHAGFMSIGAFSGIIASQWIGSAFPDAAPDAVRIIAALITGGVIAGIAGILIGIPVLRLRGDYLAIVTLAFGEIIRNLLNCVYFSADGAALHFGFNNPNLPGKLIVNGPMGATGVNRLATFEAGFVLVLFTLFVVMNLVGSRSGRAIMAARDNRIAAEAMGINVTKYKMIAFVTSAALAGMAGALYGLNFATTQAAKFKFDTSILVLVFVVLGGIGSIRGSVIAATLLTILPEVLRGFGDYRMLVYAIVLIVVMITTNSPLLLSLLNRVRPQKAGIAKEGSDA